MQVLIAGAGLNGCLSALALARRGWSCTVLDGGPPDRSGPASDHAHSFRAQDLAALAGLADLPEPPAIGIGRHDLLMLLRRRLEDCAQVHWNSKARQVLCRGEGVSVAAVAGGECHADLALDATGQAFAIAGRAAESEGMRLDLEEIPDRWIYESYRLTDAPDGFDVRPCGVGRLVCAVKNGTGIATVMAPRDAMPDDATRSAALAARGDKGATAVPAFAGQAPKRFGGAALSITRVPATLPVLCVGDALLRTPPRYGDGLRHALAMARCLEQAGSIRDARGQLFDYAEAVWAATSIAMAMETAGQAG